MRKPSNTGNPSSRYYHQERPMGIKPKISADDPGLDFEPNPWELSVQNDEIKSEPSLLDIGKLLYGKKSLSLGGQLMPYLLNLAVPMAHGETQPNPEDLPPEGYPPELMDKYNEEMYGTSDPEEVVKVIEESNKISADPTAQNSNGGAYPAIIDDAQNDSQDWHPPLALPTPDWHPPMTLREKLKKALGK